MEAARRQDDRAPLSPLELLSTNIPLRKVRRKSSFITKVDSSEDIPSPHDSIFEALCFSLQDHQDINESSKGGPAELVAQNVPLTISIARSSDENNIHETHLRKGDGVDAEFRYGHGTVLDTITEQKSCGTMRTEDGINSCVKPVETPLFRHRDTLAFGHTTRRQQAFSLDDLALIQSSYHEACVMIEREAQKPVRVHEIYAGPREPVQAPPERPDTPQGMPSWTSSQQVNRVIATPATRPTMHILPHRRFRSFFHINQRTQSSVNRNHTVSDPITNRLAPRFRPPRSVYGLIDQHPFNSVPIAQVNTQTTSSPQPSSIKGQNTLRHRGVLGVRFTPSATARDSEVNVLVNAIESTTDSAPHPTQPFHAPQTVLPMLQVKCSHTKGRRIVSNLTHNLNHAATDPPSFEYVASPSFPNSTIDRSAVSDITLPTRPISELSIDRQSRTTLQAYTARSPSISSTTQLVSGGLAQPVMPFPLLTDDVSSNRQSTDRSQVQVEAFECWKRKVNNARRRFRKWAAHATSYIRLVCCSHVVKTESTPPPGARDTQRI